MPAEDPLLIPTDAGLTLRCGGVTFYPAHNPVEYARRKARTPSLLPHTLLYVPSVGLGHGLQELLSRLPAHSAILCIETRQDVMRCALSQPLPRDPRLLIVRTAEEAGVKEALKSLGYSEGSFPEAERAAREVLALPIFPELREDEQQTVVAAIAEFLS